MTDKKPAPGRYKTTNWRQYNAALKSRGSLTLWLDTGMQWSAQPNGKRGRDQTFSGVAIEFCLTIQCLYGLPLHQNLGMAQSLLELVGLDWPMLDFSTVSHRQKTLQVRLPYRLKKRVPDLLVDSTGIKFLGEGEWKRRTHGAEYHRQWRKGHPVKDAQTLEIRAIEVTDNTVGDPSSCHRCRPRYRWMRRSAVSVLMALTTRRAAMMRLPNVGPTRRLRRAKMRLCARRAGWSLGAQPDDLRWPATRAQNLKSVERLSLARSGGNQDALLQRLGERVVVDLKII